MTSVQELSCIFCKESFKDKESLQIHFRKHGDPKFNQTAKTKLRLQNDSPTSSDASRDGNEMVSCDVCTEVFPTISKAITHKHKVHPDYDAKYFCPWCGKLFTLKYLYNKHLESSHDTMANEVTSCFHCDCCDVDFFVPSAMVYHNKLFHRQDRDMISIGYSKKVKLLCQELVQIYYCPFCGEEYENKVNLNKHMADDHSDENQSPEDGLRCPLCEALFYHLDAYELHLTFHSSEDLYNEENEMIKQIVEFSLDSVPPLMEKLDNPPIVEDNDDLNSMGVDQFLQLTMNKEGEEEQANHTEKVKSKKHKKHKKSKKSITLDEFLNMNTDLFGEGVNIHGIEEVTTRVVTKQLKSKREPIQKNKVLPPDIDKLKKQGITIKMKSGQKNVPTNIQQQPISASPKPTPKKSNLISTSSEVLSKLMNQSNSQIKIVKKGAPSNPNIEVNTNETNNTITSKSEDLYESKENDDFSEETKYMSADNINEDITSETDFDKSGEENTPDNETVQNKEIKSPLSMETKSNTFNEKPSVVTDSNNEINVADDFNTNRSNDSNQDFFTENPSSSITNNTNQEINLKDGQTLNDFEESLVGTKIPRRNTSENFYKESQNKVNKKNVANNETIIEQKDKTNNTLNAIKHLSHLITVKPVNQSKPSSKGKEGEINHCSQSQVQELHHEISNEDEKDNIHENCSIPTSKLEKQKDHTPEALNALKNLSKHVTIKSLMSQVSSPKLDDKFSDDSDNPDSIDDLDNRESTYRTSTNNIVGRKVLDNRIKSEAVIKTSQADSPTHGISKKLIIKKPLETDSESNSVDENVRMNTSNADLLKRLTNVTAKPISSKMPVKQLTAQTSEQPTNIKKENITERVMKQEKINEEIEIFNIDDSDSDDQDKPEEDNEVKTTKLPIKSVSDTIDIKSIPRSFQALRNLGKNITVKSNTQTSITHSTFKDEENFLSQNKAFSDEDEDFDQNNERIDKSMNHFIDQSNKMLQSTLKNLGKHLTVKSRNLQNLSQIKHEEKNPHEKICNNDTESDSDSAVGKVKITEVTDHASEDEFLSDGECKNFVQSPNSNNSDVEDNFAEDENPQHFSEDDSYSHHAKVKMKSNENTNQSPTPTSSLRHTASTECNKSPLDNFKKFNKEITIRSLSENKRTNISTENEEGNANKDSDIANNVNKELSLKPYKQNTKIIKSENQPISSTTNENVGTSNQVSTVNKEVSVKTFQSQTVIEEITTTVTKTIRTVKQEVKNINQVNTNPTFKPHKIVNFNQGKNTHNATTIRNPSPSIGTKVKYIASSKYNASGIRPTNQIVPVRPGLHMTKAGNSSRLPVIRNVTPSSKLPPQNTVACRALRISPQVKNQSSKRPSQESVGQFSCFKKPKESPTDLQISRSEQEGETAMHVSATQSRSDFTSTVKSMKGKTLVTSTQIKSEMSASSHVSKLGNMSGLKIVKTSSKQSAQVEERMENSGAKRTMEALQKLQMQGLLVKRPRTDDDEDNDLSNSGSENDDDDTSK